MLRRFIAVLASAALGATLVGAPAQAVSLLGNQAAASQTFTTGIAPPPNKPNGKALKGITSKKGLPPGKSGGGVTASLVGGGYKYAGQHEAHNGVGVSVSVRVQNPYISGGAGNHSLTEADVELSVDNTADGIVNPKRNIVEVGITKDNGVCASTTSKFCVFVFAWANGVPGAYNGGGFVEYTAYCSTVGAICAGDDAASWVGTSKHYVIQYFNAAWWIGIENNWIGWFPDSKWTGATPPVNTFKGITDYIQNFGEVYTAGTSCDDMTNGLYADNNVAPFSGNVASAGYVGEPVTNVNMVTFATHPALYSANHLSARSTTIGGPGETSTGVTPGNPGSC